jgi:hypothetical protein
MKTSIDAQSSSVYAHRGVWEATSQQNTLTSFYKSVELGYSIETDIRYQDEQIVLSHDPLISSAAVKFFEILDFECSFALNIKNDGLQEFLLENLDWITRTNSFVFDGSIPEMWKYKNLCIPHSLRLSEYEQELPWEAPTLWLDSFHNDWWIGNSRVEDLFKHHNTIIVSPEIHGRDPKPAWDRIGHLLASKEHSISICTDYPEDFMNWVK